MAWAPGKPLRLATDNYIMRSMRSFQIDDYVFNWIMDRELTNYSGLPRFPNRKALEQWLKRFDNRHRFLLNITCRETDRVIGLQKLDYYPNTESAKADVVIGDREYWGRDVVLETRSKLLDFAYYRLRCHKVYGMVMARNVPAIFNYKALGFRCEGVLKDHDVSMLGERCDILMFGLLRNEWDEIRKEKQL